MVAEGSIGNWLVMFCSPTGDGSDDSGDEEAEEDALGKACFVVLIAFVFDYEVSFHGGFSSYCP